MDDKFIADLVKETEKSPHDGRQITGADIRAMRDELRKIPQPKRIAFSVHPDSYGAQMLREFAVDPDLDPADRAAFQALVNQLDGKKEKP